MKIFHGGCHGCVNQALKGIGYCDGCRYRRANWNLPNLYRDGDDLLELKKLYEEIFMSNDKKDIRLGEWQIRTQPDLNRGDSNRVEPPVGMPNKPTSCELNNTIGALQTAKRWALIGFDEWNAVTGYVPENTGYYFEITSLIEDAVEYGFGVAHNQNLKTIRQKIKDGENGLEKIK